MVSSWQQDTLRHIVFSEIKISQLLLFQNLDGSYLSLHLNRWRAPMQILFKSRSPQAAQLHDLAQRRMRFVFRRLLWLVPQGTVELSDVNGPRGGVDKRCKVEVKTVSAGTVVVTSMAPNWRTALDNALARAAKFVTRRLRRGHDARRLPQRAIAMDQ